MKEEYDNGEKGMLTARGMYGMLGRSIQTKDGATRTPLKPGMNNV